MIFIFFLLVFILYLVFIPCRLAFTHPIHTTKYSFKDTYKYFKYKKYNILSTGKIVCYVGLFGKGKTISAVHQVCKLYRKYNNKPVFCFKRLKFVTQKVEIISNVQLLNVPYIQFVGLNQIYQASEKNKDKDIENNTITITLVLGDEFSVQLNSRSFKDNINSLFLNTLLTCRHHHISFYYTAQRFGHVDALLRQVTSYVVDCSKVWRLQCHYYYDAWDMENSTNALLIKPLRKTGFFVKDSDYNAYDTLATVQNLKKQFDKGDMLTDNEILDLQCNISSDMDAVTSPSRLFKRNKKKTR